MVGRFCHRKR